MTIFLFIKQALSSIWSNKLRSFLSTLGIMIGISSFVIMLSIGEGVKESVLKSAAGNGNVIKLVISQSATPENRQLLFTKEMAEDIEKKVPGVKKVIKKYTAPAGELSYNGKSFYGTITPTSPEALSFQGLEVEYGSYFSKEDFTSGKKFAILGKGLVSKELSGGDIAFRSAAPIGETITLSGQNFIVKGVFKEKDWTTNGNIFILSSTYEKIFSNTSIDSFEIHAENEEVAEQTKTYLEFYLKNALGVKKGEKVPFKLQTNKADIKAFEDMSQKFTLLLGGIGAIALIVGGIGIMNIMVVSVTERTREIGIRKAIGATNTNILFQFLVESIILTLFGSFIAICFSFGVVALIAKNAPDLQLVINANVLMIATTVSITMGIIFGLMPAYKAARLKPIDALHFE